MVNNSLVSIIIEYNAFEKLIENNDCVTELLDNFDKFFWEIYVEMPIFQLIMTNIYWRFKDSRIHKRMIFVSTRNPNLFYNKIKYLNTFINEHKLLDICSSIIYCGIKDEENSEIEEECPFVITSNSNTIHKIMEGL